MDLLCAGEDSLEARGALAVDGICRGRFRYAKFERTNARDVGLVGGLLGLAADDFVDDGLVNARFVDSTLKRCAEQLVGLDVFKSAADLAKRRSHC